MGLARDPRARRESREGDALRWRGVVVLLRCEWLENRRRTARIRTGFDTTGFDTGLDTTGVDMTGVDTTGVAWIVVDAMVLRREWLENPRRTTRITTGFDTTGVDTTASTRWAST